MDSCGSLSSTILSYFFMLISEINFHVVVFRTYHVMTNFYGNQKMKTKMVCPFLLCFVPNNQYML